MVNSHLIGRRVWTTSVQIEINWYMSIASGLFLVERKPVFASTCDGGQKIAFFRLKIEMDIS